MHPPTGPAWLVLLETTGLAVAMRQWLWLYPIVEILHIIGLAVFVGAAALFDLRLLGVSRIRIPAYYRSVFPDFERADYWNQELKLSFCRIIERRLGVIGVDLDEVISSGEPRRRWPRKKRQNNKREHSTVRARGLVLRCPPLSCRTRELRA